MLRAVRHPTPDDYVVATGQAHTVEEFVAAAFDRVDIADWRRFVRTDPAFVRPVDAAVQVGDASRAGEVLGWSPTVGFAEVVGRMVDADVERLARA
jgi:GDPmannose 4,6-dehydratase